MRIFVEPESQEKKIPLEIQSQKPKLKRQGTRAKEYMHLHPGCPKSNS